MQAGTTARIISIPTASDFQPIGAFRDLLRFALNHMTVASQSFTELLNSSVQLGCCGVELRNDLPQDMIDGQTTAAARRLVQKHGLEILAVAQVSSFDQCNESMLSQARALIAVAVELDAGGVVFIPDNSGQSLSRQANKDNLRQSIRELKPLLEAAQLTGFIEPLGFDTASLRYKVDAIDAIDAAGALSSFKLVHDTFHHTLAGESQFFPEQTGMVHISGVADSSLAPSEMLDQHRGLVNDQDCINTLEQLQSLTTAGYQGPVSFEVFAPEVHALAKPVDSIKDSIEFIRFETTANAA